MDRNDILEKSRKENRNMDERERDALAKAGQRATAVGGIVCAFIIIFESIVSDFVSLSTWAVYLSMTGTTLLVKYSILRRKHELLLSLLELALAIICMGMYIKRLLG
jgi:preprotein translocase subunit SecY